MIGNFAKTEYVYIDTLTGNILHGGKDQTTYTNKNNVKKSMAHSGELYEAICNEWLSRNGHDQVVKDCNAALEYYQGLTHLNYGDPIKDLAWENHLKVSKVRRDLLKGLSDKEYRKLRKELTSEGGRFKIMQIKEVLLIDPKEE